MTNEDATPEEFDSTALKVEKVIPGKSKASSGSGSAIGLAAGPPSPR